MAGSRKGDQPDITPKPGSGSNAVVLKTLTTSKTNEVEDKIREGLYAFCAGLAKDLDEKQGIAAKYFQVKSNNPKEIDEKADSDDRKLFLENFSEFYKELRAALDQITKEDIKTITSEKKSEALKRFIHCFEKLNKFGFYNANGRPINFWSGDEAQAEANQTLFSLSDADVPSIAILSKLGNLLKDASLRSLSDVAFFAGSALFADQASGNVLVYSSASNMREEERNVFTVNNFHWNIELGIVRAKQKAGDVKNIYYIGYNHSKNNWKQSGLSLVSLNENEELEENLRKNAEESYTPILVQKNNAFFIYGDPDGNGSWRLTALNSMADDSRALLQTLPFNGCDLFLLDLDEDNDGVTIEADIIKKVRSKSSPLLIRKKSDNTFFIYGYQENTGCWDFTPIETKNTCFDELPFSQNEMTMLPRNHPLFDEDLITSLSMGHDHFHGIIRGEDAQLAPVSDALKAGHANWQKLFNANNLSQNSLSLALRRNSLEGFFKLGLMDTPTRFTNTIYIENNREGKGLDYEVIGPDGSLEMDTIPWNKLPRELKNSPKTLNEIKDITGAFLAPIAEYLSSKKEIQLPTREQKKQEREKWIKTGPERPFTPTHFIFDLLSPRLERSRSRSDSLSPSPGRRARSSSQSPKRRPSGLNQSSKQAISIEIPAPHSGEQTGMPVSTPTKKPG